MKHCKGCLFWDKQQENFGLCHRMPPITCVNPSVSAGYTTGFDTGSYFPETHSEAWCGEWKPRVIEIDIPGVDGYPGVHEFACGICGHRWPAAEDLKTCPNCNLKESC